MTETLRELQQALDNFEKARQRNGGNLPAGKTPVEWLEKAARAVITEAGGETSDTHNSQPSSNSGQNHDGFLAEYGARVIENLNFPSAIRKMWAAHEITDWLQDQAKQHRIAQGTGQIIWPSKVKTNNAQQLQPFKYYKAAVRITFDDNEYTEWYSVACPTTISINDYGLAAIAVLYCIRANESSTIEWLDYDDDILKHNDLQEASWKGDGFVIFGSSPTRQYQNAGVSEISRSEYETMNSLLDSSIVIPADLTIPEHLKQLYTP